MLQVIVHRVAQIELDTERRLSAAVAADIGEDERQRRDREQDQQPRPQWVIARDDHLVDDLSRDQRHEHLSAGAQNGSGDRKDHVAAMQHQERPEATHPAWFWLRRPVVTHFDHLTAR